MIALELTQEELALILDALDETQTQTKIAWRTMAANCHQGESVHKAKAKIEATELLLKKLAAKGAR